MNVVAIYRCVCAIALIIFQNTWAQPGTSLDVPVEFVLLAPTGASFTPLGPLPTTHARVVFYREASGVEQSTKPSVVSVFLNGKYFTSLQTGAHSYVCLTPGQIEAAARSVENGVLPTQAFDVVNTLSLRGGQEVFVKVRRDPNKPAVMLVMPAMQAKVEVAQTHVQQHTLSRVNGSCNDATVTPPVKPRPEAPASVRRLTLSADAMFEFGKSDIQNIPPQGRRLLDHVADRIKSEFGAGTQVEIRIVGHADKFGSEAKNLRISQERAQSVKSYLVKSGLIEKNIFTEGRGDKEPVVTRCGDQFNKVNRACTRPNRRIELEMRTK